jgi:hypothetical protein
MYFSPSFVLSIKHLILFSPTSLYQSILNKWTVVLKYWKLMDVAFLALVDSLVYKK